MTGTNKNVDENEKLFVVSATDDDNNIHSQNQVREKDLISDVAYFGG